MTQGAITTAAIHELAAKTWPPSAECAVQQICIDPERKELAEQARRIINNVLAE